MKKIILFNKFYSEKFTNGGSLRSLNYLIENLINDFEITLISEKKNELNKNKKKNIYNFNNTKLKLLNIDLLYIINLFFYFNKVNHDKKITIYFNSFFDTFFSIIPIILIKVFFNSKFLILLNTRGELLNGALSLKEFKKKRFMQVIKYLKIYKNVYFITNNFLEKKNLIEYLNIFPKNIFINSEFVGSANIYPPLIKKAKKTNKLIFIGRIAKIKNLEFLLDLAEQTNINFILNIFGPIVDKEYYLQIKKRIEFLNRNKLNVKISYKGIVNNNDIIKTISVHDIMLLPSHSENFGYVIYESIIANTPIIASNNVLFKNYKKNCLIKLPLKIEMWDKEISRILSLNSEGIQNILDECKSLKRIIYNKNIENKEYLIKFINKLI